MEHDWEVSRLGHGELMCRRCFMTNREASALGLLHSCGEAFDPEKKLKFDEPRYK